MTGMRVRWQEVAATTCCKGVKPGRDCERISVEVEVDLVG